MNRTLRNVAIGAGAYLVLGIAHNLGFNKGYLERFEEDCRECYKEGYNHAEENSELLNGYTVKNVASTDTSDVNHDGLADFTLFDKSGRRQTFLRTENGLEQVTGALLIFTPDSVAQGILETYEGTRLPFKGTAKEALDLYPMPDSSKVKTLELDSTLTLTF